MRRSLQNIPGTSRFPHAVLTQARIERFMMDAMKDFGVEYLNLSLQCLLTLRNAGGLTVDLATLPLSLTVSPDLSLSHPVTVTLRHLSEEETTPTQVGTVPTEVLRSPLMADNAADALLTTRTPGDEEILSARFMVGCDGARSWVRK